MQSLLSHAVNLFEDSSKSVNVDEFDVSSPFITERTSDSMRILVHAICIRPGSEIQAYWLKDIKHHLIGPSKQRY